MIFIRASHGAAGKAAIASSLTVGQHGGGLADRPKSMRAYWQVGLLTGLALIGCSGCSSLGGHLGDEFQGVYPGVGTDVTSIAHPPHVVDSVMWGDIPRGVTVTFAILDTPLSLALDTVLLPVDLAHRSKPEAPMVIEVELQEIRLLAAVASETPEGPSRVPVRVKISNPRPKAVNLNTGCLVRIIRCSDYVDSDGQAWELPWGGINAFEDNRAVVSIGAHSDAEFELAIPTAKGLLRPGSHGPGTAGSVGVPAALRYAVRDTHVETGSGAWIRIRGCGTVSVRGQ
jgi:uncharacterized protein YceK